MDGHARTTLEAELARLGDAGGSLRQRFCLACIDRIAHLIEPPEARNALADFRGALREDRGPWELVELTSRAAAIARGHAGSPSIDGSGHASVSATHALARAIAGDALGTADYAAYAATYSYGGYAVREREAFEPEYAWQLQALRGIVSGR